MKHGIQISATFKEGFGMELVNLRLKTSEGEITLNGEQYDEIQKTLNGKRETVYSEEMVGYYPKDVFVWN